jgi:hypothetical protein
MATRCRGCVRGQLLRDGEVGQKVPSPFPVGERMLEEYRYRRPTYQKGGGMQFSKEKRFSDPKWESPNLIWCCVQVVEDGYEFFAKRQLVTLFSAPNYCGEFDNAGGMMSVDETLMCSFQVPPRLLLRLLNLCRLTAGYVWRCFFFSRASSMNSRVSVFFHPC